MATVAGHWSLVTEKRHKNNGQRSTINGLLEDTLFLFPLPSLLREGIHQSLEVGRYDLMNACTLLAIKLERIIIAR